MKKIAGICIVLLIGILFFSCTKTNKQNEPITDLEIYNLEGKVKQVKEFTFDEIDKFGEIVKGDRINYLENSRTIFNVSGNKIEDCYYKANTVLMLLLIIILKNVILYTVI